VYHDVPHWVDKAFQTARSSGVRKIPLHVEAVEQVPDSDVLILDFVIIGRDRSIWHGRHNKDEPCNLYALFAE